MHHRLWNSALSQVIRRETGRIANSWILLFATLVGPVLSFLFVTWIFAAGVVRDLPVVVVDRDNSQMSGKIRRTIDALPAAVVTSGMATLAEAEQVIRNGEADAILYIPEGLEKSVLKGGQAEVAVFINNANVVKGGMLQSQVTTALAGLSGSIRVQSMMKQGVPAGEAARRAQPVRADVHLLVNPFANYAYFLVTGLLPLLAVSFIFLGTAYAIGIEMKDGSAGQWIGKAGGSMTVAITGKLIPYIFLFFADLVFMDWLLISRMGTPLKGSLAAILMSEGLLVLAYQAMALLLLTVTVNLRLTLSLGSAYSMKALTFSGLTFPTMAMPLAARLFSFLFPYTFWLKTFLSQSMRGEPLHEMMVPLSLLVPFILAGIAVIPFCGKRFADPRWLTRA